MSSVEQSLSSRGWNVAKCTEHVEKTGQNEGRESIFSNCLHCCFSFLFGSEEHNWHSAVKSNCKSSFGKCAFFSNIINTTTINKENAVKTPTCVYKEQLV